MPNQSPGPKKRPEERAWGVFPQALVEWHSVKLFRFDFLEELGLKVISDLEDYSCLVERVVILGIDRQRRMVELESLCCFESLSYRGGLQPCLRA